MTRVLATEILNEQPEPRIVEVSVYRKEKTEALIHFTVEEQACGRARVLTYLEVIAERWLQENALRAKNSQGQRELLAERGLAMSDSSLIKPLLHGNYPVIDFGEGIFLYDQSGKEYLDASSGAITANIGHGVEEIRSAAYKQMGKVSFVYRSQFTSEAAEGLASKLSEMTDGEMKYCFFVNSGSEATETALKIALQHWQEKGLPRKNRIISRWMSYHGITLGALSMSGHAQRRERFVSLLEEYPSVSPPYCYRCPLGLKSENCGLACADELLTMVRRIGKENIAAFICEPVIGAAGAAIPSPPGYLKRIREICTEHEILLISDEVMTGVGRTGEMLGCRQAGIVPDIVALGKGMSGGYTPIAATLATEYVIDPIKKGSGLVMSGHTFSANPLSCAVSLEVLSYIEKNGLFRNSLDKGGYLLAKLEALQKKYPIIGDIRGQGLLIGIEFVKDPVTKEPYERSKDVSGLIVKQAQENGLLLYPAQAGIDGVIGDACLIGPPLTITEKECDELINRFERTLADVCRMIA